MSQRLWIVIVCAGSIIGLSVGLRQAMGLFLDPVSIQLGLGRETFALAMGLMNLFWGLGAPFAGAVADRYGAGRVAVLGGAAYAAGLLIMMASPSGEHLLVGGTLIGFGLSGTAFTVVLGVVGRSAPTHLRSQALGLASVGGSIGQFAALPYAHAMIEGFGWVLALGILAATALLIVPLAYGIAGRPEDHTSAESHNIRQALETASKIPSFWLLNAGFFVCGFHLAFVGVHLPAFLADEGFAPWLATAALMAVGVTNIIGVYTFGTLGGLYSKKMLLSGLYLARAAVFFLFIVIPINEVSVLLFGATMGFLWLGTVPLTSGLVGHIFGTRYMSMLFGVVFFGHQMGGFLGAWLAGMAFDRFGSYDAMWWSSVLLGLLSAALHWPIDEREIPAMQAAT